MSEEYMKQLAETFKIQQSQMAEQQAQITNLLTAMQQMPGMQEPVKVEVRPPVANAADVRAEKVQKLALSMRKSNRFKVFKVHADSDIKLFLKKFDEEIKSLKVMVGIKIKVCRCTLSVKCLTNYVSFISDTTLILIVLCTGRKWSFRHWEKIACSAMTWTFCQSCVSIAKCFSVPNISYQKTISAVNIKQLRNIKVRM